MATGRRRAPCALELVAVGAQLEVWFVHNLADSTNVTQELRQVEQTAVALLKHPFSEVAEQIQVRTLQVSRDRLQAW